MALPVVLKIKCYNFVCVCEREKSHQDESAAIKHPQTFPTHFRILLSERYILLYAYFMVPPNIHSFELRNIL